MKTSLTINRDFNEGEKFPPQAKTIVAAVIAKVGLGKPVDRQAIVDELKEAGTLNTRQDVSRVLAFYQPKLEDAGILTITKESEATDKEPKAAKAPKEKTPAAAE